jgi:flagellar biosynthesis/type III secretory pathway M-ring protein FliF/YscJ
MIDQEADLGEVKDLTGAVSAAAGLDSRRGDTVVITRLPFQAAEKGEDKGSRVDAVRDFYFRVGRDFAAIVLAVLFLKFAAGMLRRGKTEPGPQTATRTETPAAVSVAPSPPPAEVQIDPDKAASVLRTWLSADETSGNGGA